MNISEFLNAVTSGRFDNRFRRLYGGGFNNFLHHRARYISAAEKFSWLYPECDEIRIFSVPQTVRIAGSGSTSLHAAVGMDMIAFVGKNNEKNVSIVNENVGAIEFGPEGVDISEDETAIWSESAAALAAEIPPECGLCIYIFPEITSENLGMASLILAKIFNEYNPDKKTKEELAEIVAEVSGADRHRINAVSDGGFWLTDNTESISEHIHFDMSASGYTLCICETDETDCGYCGLAYDDEEKFLSDLPELNKTHSDAELLYMINCLDEKRRAYDAAEALRNGDTDEFFNVMNEKIVFSSDSRNALAFAVGKKLLGGSGAIKAELSRRLLAFIPNYYVGEFVEKYNRILGIDSCRTANLRAEGLCELTEATEEQM